MAAAGLERGLQVWLAVDVVGLDVVADPSGRGDRMAWSNKWFLATSDSSTVSNMTAIE